MKKIPIQTTFAEIYEDYRAFVEKFKPKKTTDDCYTPQNVYEVIARWVCKQYGIEESQIVRPFYPGGDYERFPYEETSVVIDNPPFSILSQIVAFYNAHGVPYFLFAPHLTNFGIGGGMECCHVIESATITYENGAEVNTSFVTNLDDRLIFGSPELYALIKAENTKNVKAMKKELPKYAYPDNVVTASAVGWIVSKGIPYELRREDAFHIRVLDSQRAVGKAIFGSGFLISEKAAAEKAAAEKAAAEKAAAEKAAAEKARATRWQLSENEKRIIAQLGKEKR